MREDRTEPGKKLTARSARNDRTMRLQRPLDSAASTARFGRIVCTLSRHRPDTSGTGFCHRISHLHTLLFPARRQIFHAWPFFSRKILLPLFNHV
ncbi:hypothetical protein BACCOPRO_03316 [Phocaeicola coprophilus DSM 18228 = JCM 13818]|uniref:Uncharacterized protein n=1 Tax=Phocaeicola coprophilus DSM 18228 = JCM 13818 TaxID=547042 RepID=S0FBF1_9BACT|nr:hypothetical protein BACCOPRO_03316 [Phocaeicola coprophilus DSM 18228 = JCM 13818]